MKKIILATTLLASILYVQAQENTGLEGQKTMPYQETTTRVNDLVHTKLEVKFDYDKSYLYGKATITLQPHFYATDSVILDAKEMTIAKVALVKGTTTLPLTYKYDGLFLNIHLDKLYKASEKYTVYIEYTSKPNEFKAKGSAAITDAKGLYFINPKGEQKDKPIQIWTQGETEGTSVWCPTIDRPNQKTTNEFYMTVPDKYVTLSNGLLTTQKKNADGTRTDYWKMDMPHAPYLFFMGVGDYAIVKDSYKGKEVNYYVEKEYAPVAKKIFGLTPEMMAFYSRITGVEYPWQKYNQITARDYVSGAMENTTATLHQESAQQDARQLVDGNGWETVVAHELFHQWFGDYVTCESWSNITLNESFANYSETLWNQYKYGNDAGDDQNFTHLQEYLFSQSESKDLVRFKYADKEDVFDAVSYNKGGRILHMLRNYLGDSAFFKGLNSYLVANKFKSAEAHQLRLALEEVSGKDLNWFFNQWYFGNGHPKLTINYLYNDTAGKATVIINQTQTTGKVFRLPIAVDVYTGKEKIRHQIWVNNKTDSFTFKYTKRPDLINVDADKILLCEKKDNKTLDNFVAQYKLAGNYLDRKEAIDFCAKSQSDPKALSLLTLALKDKFYKLRKYTLEKLNHKDAAVVKQTEPIIAEMAKAEPRSVVKAVAINVLAGYQKQLYKSLFVKAVVDSSYAVAGEALEGLYALDSTAGFAEAKKQSLLPAKSELADAMMKILMKHGQEEDFDVLATLYEKMPLSAEKMHGIGRWSAYLLNINNSSKFKKGIDLIVQVREAIPADYKSQTTPMINEVLSQLLSKKKAAVLANPSFQEQVDYISGKLK
jgi:aminopeptidase N